MSDTAGTWKNDMGRVTGLRGMMYQQMFSDEALISEIGEHLAGAIGPQVAGLVEERDRVRDWLAALREDISSLEADLAKAEERTRALRAEGSALIATGGNPRTLDTKIRQAKENEAQLSSWLEEYRNQEIETAARLKEKEAELYAAIMYRVESFVPEYAERLNDFLRQASALDTCWQKGITECFKSIRGDTAEIRNFSLRLKVTPDSKFGRK